MLVEEKIINFRTSKLAFEKGFDCYGWSAFMYESKFIENGSYYLLEYKRIKVPEKYWDSRLKFCPQSLLQKWLRDIHGIQIDIFDFIIRFDNPITKYDYCVRHKMVRYEKAMAVGYVSYENALEAALLVALSLI